MRRSFLTLTWLLSDALIFAGAYSLAYFIKVGWIFSSDLPYQTYIAAVGITIPGWLFVMLTMRNFALSREQRSIRNFMYIAYASAIGMAGFTLAFYFIKAAVFSRLLLLIAGVFSTILIFVWHIVFDRIQRIALRTGKPTYPMLIIGTNRETERLIEKLQRGHSPFTPVAILSVKGGNSNEIAGVPVLGKLNKLEEVIKEKHITHLVQCDHLEHSINLLSVCREHKITYFLLPFVLGVIEDHVPTEALEGQQVVAVEHGAKWHWFFR